MYVSVNKNNIIKACSPNLVKSNDLVTYYVTNPQLDDSVVGKKLKLTNPKTVDQLKIAYICNWGDRCGIATYSKLLIDAITPLVKEVRIFAEETNSNNNGSNIDRCWKRGESMVPVIQKINEWKPDIIHVQHEYGIFPKATHFLKMLEMLAPNPYLITTHSVYEHLDKSICSACIKNTIVHSQEAKNILEKLGNLNNIYVVKHGCVTYPDNSELWNIFKNDYSIIQFGFGFNYKGVDQALDAIHHLKTNDSKFKDIFYCYLCSENPHTKSVHEEYYSYLKNKIDSQGLTDNVVVLRGFLSEKIISNFLRTAKLAIFPYKNDPHNSVYGASGAIRNAMANAIPIIASDSHLFDDLDGIVPRVNDYLSLAQEIDKVFSNQEYRQSLINKNLKFVDDHTWQKTAKRHLEIYGEIIKKIEQDYIHINEYETINP